MATYTTSATGNDGTWVPATGIWAVDAHSIANAPYQEVVYRFMRPVGLDTLLSGASLRLPIGGVIQAGVAVTLDVVTTFADLAPSVANLPRWQRTAVATANTPAGGVTWTIDLVPGVMPVALFNTWRRAYGGSVNPIAFVLYSTAGAPGPIIDLLGAGDGGTPDPPELVATETSANTGRSGVEYLRGRRASSLVTCYRTGRVLAADEAVRDGYTGQLVDPIAYDPPGGVYPPDWENL